MHLKTPLKDAFRITPLQYAGLKRLGLETVQDLLYHTPTRYSNMSTVRSIREVNADEKVTLYGRIKNLKSKKGFAGKAPRGEALLEDVNGDTIKVVWFHQVFIVKTLTEGALVKLTGTIAENSYGLSMTNPEIEHTPFLPIDMHRSLFQKGSDAEYHFGYPIYRESRGITSKWFYHANLKIFGIDLMDTLTDPIPEDILKKYNLPSLRTALVWVHTLQKQADADSAQKRFAF